MSEADIVVVGQNFEITSATPNDSHTSLRNELKIDLEKRAEVEERNELEEAGEEQENSVETEEDLSSPQEAGSDKELREDPEESHEDLKQSEELKALRSEISDVIDFESAEELQNPGSSGDTEALTLGSSFVSHHDLKALQKFNQSDEERDTEEELGGQKGCGDTSSVSCSSYERLRTSIVKRDCHSSTLSLNSVCDLEYLTERREKLKDLEGTCDETLSYSSSVSIAMKGRSRSLSHNGYEREVGPESHQSSWPYFKRSEIDGALSVFKKVDEDKNGYISLCELKRFLEILEIPQTHLKAKKMMANVVGDSENRLNFAEVLLIHGSLMHRLVPLNWRMQQRQKSQLDIKDEVDVSQVGVTGARLFFEAKIAQQTPNYQRETLKADAEVPKRLESEP